MNEQSVEQKQKPSIACYLTQSQSYTADDLRKTMKSITNKIKTQQKVPLQESGTTKGLTKEIKKQQEELVQEGGAMKQITKKSRRSKKITKKDKKQQKESPQENRRMVSCAAHLSDECTIQQSVPSYRCASSACTRWLCSHGEAETTPHCEKCLEKQFLTPTKICNEGASCSHTGSWHYGDLKLCTQGTAGCKNLVCASCTLRSLSLFLCVRNNDIRICASCSDASLVIPSLSKHVVASKDESKGGGGRVEMTKIKEENDCLFAGLHNADTQCAVITIVQAQNAVPPLRDVTLTHQCESPETCQTSSFIELVRRANTQQPLTSQEPLKRKRVSLQRVAKARSSVESDNTAVAILTKSIKVAAYLDEEVLQQLKEKDAKKKKREVEKEQVDVGELLGKVFSGFCAEGKSQLKRLTAYHSLQINCCLKCKGEWSTKSLFQDAVPVVLNDDWGNEAKTIHEAFNFSAKPIRKRLRCNDSKCAGVEASSCTIPYGPAPHVLLLQFNYTKNRELPFQVPFTYELHATGARYELLSLNCHIGQLAHNTNGAHSGHYVNYSKRVSEKSEQEAWYRADDIVVQKLKPGDNILPGDKPYLAYYVRLPAAAGTSPEGGFECTAWGEPGPNMGSRPAQKQPCASLCGCVPPSPSPPSYSRRPCAPSSSFPPTGRGATGKGKAKKGKRPLLPPHPL